MNLHRSAVVAAMLALQMACGGEDEPHRSVETGDDNPTIDALFASRNVPGSPGCALAVSKDGTLIYSRGYGLANLDHDIPVTPQTVFDVASVTKQFVTASLSILALDGKLSFEDDVRKWLPELPEYESPITLSHMVYHTSGLRDYLNLFPLAGRNDYYPISRQQILDMMSRQRALVFPPGQRYEYSNTAYMLLALVVERISNKSLGAFVEEHIFAPVGMQSSLMYDDFERIIPRRAIGYIRDDDGHVRMTHNYNFDVPGDGQMYTTVEDLLRWDNYLHGESKPKYYSMMMEEGRLNNGMRTGRAKGLFLDRYRGRDTVHHTGSSWGFRSVVERFVDSGLAIAIACNDDNSHPRDIAWKIADHYLAGQLGPLIENEETDGTELVANAVAEPPSLAPVQPGQYAGTFVSAELDATYRVAVDSGGLAVHIEQQPPVALRRTHVDDFEFEFRPDGWASPEIVSLQFTRDRAGTITGFILDSGTERGIVFEKGKAIRSQDSVDEGLVDE